MYIVNINLEAYTIKLKLNVKFDEEDQINEILSKITLGCPPLLLLSFVVLDIMDMIEPRLSIPIISLSTSPSISLQTNISVLIRQILIEITNILHTEN